MRTILYLLCALVITPQMGQPARSTTSRCVLTTTGAFFALSVADAEASSKWYAEKLGLAVVMRSPASSNPPFVVLEGGGLIVELVERGAAGSTAVAAPAADGSSFAHGFFKAGAIIDDFDKTLAVLEKRGVEIAFGPFPAQPSQRANVIIKDNAGNLIQLFGS